MSDGWNEKAWQIIHREIREFPREVRSLPVTRPVSARQLREQIAKCFPLQTAVPLETLTAQLIGFLRDCSVHVTHPGYFGLFNPSVREAGIVGDALTALFNPQLAAWSHAPFVNELERYTLQFLGGFLGWAPGSFFANFTSGGAEANLSGVLTAISHYFPESRENGIRHLPSRPAVYLSQESHHSFVKIARMTGLGTNCLRQIPVNERLEMEVGALQAQIEKDLQEGWIPFLIAATAGTTGAGAIDPLEQIAELAREYHLWLHVDAAWGGAALLSPKLRPYLKGIERADSVTWDAHKWLSVPMGAGMLFCRHAEAIRQAFSIGTTYMPGNPEEETFDPYSSTVQWSRRAIGVKVFLSLAELGADGYRTLIEHQTAMGELLKNLLQEAGWKVVNDTPLPLACFTHEAILKGRCTTSDLLRFIYERGNIWISDVVLNGKEKVLRACVTSFHTNQQDIQKLVAEIEWARKEATA